jgi:hypothetical protein
MENSSPRQDVNNCSAVGLSELIRNSEVSKHQELIDPVSDEKTKESNQVENWKSTGVSHSNKDHAIDLCEP